MTITKQDHLFPYFYSLLFSILLLFISAQSLHAQLLVNTDPILDSLKLEVASATDSKQKVKQLLAISKRVLRSQSIEASAVFIEQAAQIANKENNKKLIADVLRQEANILGTQEAYELAEKKAQQALQYYRTVNYLLGEINALNSLGVFNKNQGKYLKAINYLEKAETLLHDTIPLKEKGITYSNLANTYSKINQFKLAYEMAFKALKTHQKAGKMRQVGSSYINIGSLYIRQNDTIKALEYYHKSVDILEKEHDLLGTFHGYGGIATLYAEQGKYVEATAFREKQLKIAQKRSSQAMTTSVQINMAQQFILMKDYSKATALIKEVAVYVDQMPKSSLIRYYLLEASLFEKDKAYPKGVESIEKAYNIVKNAKHIYKLSDILTRMHQLYSKAGRHKEAYKFLTKHKTLSDSLNSQSNIQELTRQNMQFEFHREKGTLEKEKILSKAKAKQARIISIALVIILGLLAYMLNRSNRFKEKQNELLEQKVVERTSELQKTTTELERVKAIQLLEEAKSRFFANISHEFRTPLTLIQAPLNSALNSGTFVLS